MLSVGFPGGFDFQWVLKPTDFMDFDFQKIAKNAQKLASKPLHFGLFW